MEKTIATIAFIGVVAIAGIVVGSMQTVADGRVFAYELAKTNPSIKAVDCDREIPIGVHGAVFRCRFTRPDAAVIEIEYVMDRLGATKDREIRTLVAP